MSSFSQVYTIFIILNQIANSVSYTHLDVYKRQLPNESRISRVVYRVIPEVIKTLAYKIIVLKMTLFPGVTIIKIK